jgi:tetratricopeptide (TPR) repeat protein
VTEQSEHLSSAQIENYGNRTSGAGPDAAQGDERQRVDHQSSDDESMNDQRVEAHLADCSLCRTRLLDFHRTRFALVSGPVPDAKPTDSALADSKFANSKYPVQAQVSTTPTPECPSDDALRQLAAGLSPDSDATKLTRHAATCDHCGPLLRTFTEDFSDDFSPEEQAALANLQSASAAWQKNTARQMLQAGTASATGVSADEAGGPRTAATVKSDKKPSAGRQVSTAPDRKPFFWKWVLIPATAAVVAVAAFTIWYTQRDTPAKVEKQLAQAFTEHRTMEIRWPGAEWGPVSNILGDETLSKPLPLLEADEIIGRHEKQSQDADWIRVLAERKIIDGDVQAAITLLDGALRAHPDSVPLLQVLAIAYFQLGERSHGRQDYQKAAGILSEILRREPGNRVALFNRALAYERLNALDQAEEDWKAFLSAERDEHWSGEAKKRSEELRKLK